VSWDIQTLILPSTRGAPGMLGKMWGLVMLATVQLLWPAFFRLRHLFTAVPYPDIIFALVLAYSPSRNTRTLMRQAVIQAEESETPSPVPRKLTPGTRLVRDWHGVGHTVVVTDDGFTYQGKEWKSLTAITKAITGSHRNGPAFFGARTRSCCAARSIPANQLRMASSRSSTASMPSVRPARLSETFQA